VMMLDGLGPLPEDLLPELLLPLGSDFKNQLQVCSSWRAFLDVELHWEKMCCVQWPRVVPPLGESWRHFAHRGGGYERGRKLSRALRTLSTVATQCPKGHLLRRYTTELEGFSCDVCGARDLPTGTRLRSCRRCDWDKCEICFMASGAMPSELAVGAQNCVDEEGCTSLHLGSRLGFLEVVERLLDARAGVEERDVHGYTPLMISATHGNLEVCQMLLARGANKGTRNRYGRNVVDCARVQANADLVALLSA